MPDNFEQSELYRGYSRILLGMILENGDSCLRGIEKTMAAGDRSVNADPAYITPDAVKNPAVLKEWIRSLMYISEDWPAADSHVEKSRLIYRNLGSAGFPAEKIEAAVKKEVKAEVPSVKIKEGKIYIASSYNNTIITLTDLRGNVLAWTSAGAIGFKGTKKATPFAASKVAEAISQTIKKMGIEKIAVFVKGIGSGRESAIRSLAARGLDITSITDITPVPHNGCRPPKVRRV